MKLKSKKDAIDVKQLVDDAALLDQQSKEIEKKLKTIKAQLADYITDNFFEKDLLKGVTLPGSKYIDVVTGVEKRADASPEETLEYLETIDKGDRWLDVVKVSATELEKVVGSEKSKELRPVVGITLRQSFKIVH